MKKFYSIVLIFASLLLGSTNAWAYVYSKMVLYAGEGGTVALSADKTGAYNAIKSGTENAYGSSATMILESTTWYSGAIKGTLYFYAHAKANNGYYFRHWSTSNGGASTSTDNPWHKGITSGKISQSSAVTETYYAVFAPISYTITYNLNEGVNNANNPATYTIKDATITLADPTRGGYIFDGWTTDGVSTPTKSLQITRGSTGNKTFTAHWSPATLTQSITWNQSIATQQRNNTVTLDATASSGLTVSYSASPADLVSINDNQVTCLKPGHVTITASQAGNSTYLPATSISKEFDIFATPNTNCQIVDQYYVDAAALNLESVWTREGTGAITYTIESFIPSGANNEDAIAPAINDNILSLGQAGTLVLQMAVAESGYYNATSDTKTITINKYANPIVVRFDDEVLTNNTATIAYGAGKHVTITAANPANTLVINQTAGADLATYYADQQAVYTSFKNGDATWTIAQAETYKYEAGAANFAVHVAPAATGETCYLYEYTGDERSCSDFGQDRAKWNARGVAGTLTFKARHQLAAVSPEIKVYQVVDDEASLIATITDLSTSYKDYSYTLNPNATKVYFVGSGSLNKYVKEVRVSHKTILRTSIEADVLNMPDCRLGNPVQTTFNVIWSRPSTSNNIHLESSNPHFTLSQSLIENVGCNNGTTNITITYSPIAEGEEDATITIYDESQVITLPVHGKTVTFFTPEVDWKLPAVSKLNQTYTGLDNIVTSSNALSPIVITSSDETIARYDEATHTITTLGKEGFVTFHVSQVANKDFYAINLDFSMFVTDRENTLCVLYEDGSKHSLSNVANVGVGEFEFTLDAPVSMISADIWKYSGITTGSIVVKWYNAEGTKLGEKKVGVEKLSTSPKNFVMPLQRETRRIKFEVEGTLNKYVQNIKVYRANYLEHNAALIDGALQFGSDDYDAEPTVREFDIFYSGAGDLKIESSNNALFTTTAVNRTIDCADALGQQHITVAYQHNVVSNDHAAELRIQLGAMSIILPMHGATNRPEGAVFIGDINDDWDKAENWLGGVIPADGVPVVVRGDLVINSGETRTVDQLTIESTGSVLVVDNGTLIVNGTKESENGEYGVLRVNLDGNVQLNSTLKVSDFYLSALLNPIAGHSESGQVSNIEQLQTINGNCYFELKLDPTGACSEGWYMFTVPFAVETAGGISRYEGDVLTPVALGRNFVLREYSESNRANGKTDWVNFTGTLQPGRLYAIAVDDVYPTYRFTKKTGEALTNNASQTLTCTAGSAEASERGWCGIGNGTFQHATLSAAGISKAQIYNHQSDAYQTVTLSECAFVVGSACFVQTPASGSALYTSGTSGILRAPAYTDDQEEVVIRFGAAESDRADVLYISATDEAKSSYIIGRDLKKMGVSATTAQIWTNAYNQRLCDIEGQYHGNQAEFSISLFAPKAGEYTIAQQHLNDNMSLYLLQDGMPVWDLAMDDYTLDLTKGTDSSYSLMLVRRAPAVTTGIGETTDSDATKLLINGQIFVLTNGQTYDLTGRRIR